MSLSYSDVDPNKQAESSNHVDFSKNRVADKRSLSTTINMRAKRRKRKSNLATSVSVRQRDHATQRRPEEFHKQQAGAFVQTTAQQPDQVFLLDQQGICQDYLTEDVTQDGKLRQEHLGRSLAELVPADLANQIYARLQKVFTERKSQTLEYSSVVGDQVRYAEAASASYASQGTETIFVVEDDEQIRALASFILQEQGYTVLVAANGAEALQIADEHPHPIDLLLTDVIMPGMSGRQLSNELTAVRPNLKVLFVSGYTRFEIAAYGVLDSGIAFLPKPYTPDLLAQRVRELLDQG